jgi:uncharacterized protein YegL
MYPDDTGAQRKYFSLEDAAAVSALSVEAGEPHASQLFPALTFYMNGLSGGDFTIQATRQTVLNGRPARPIIAPGVLLLPDCYTVLDAKDRPKLYRAAVAHAVAHLKYSPAAQPSAGLKPLGIAVVSIVEDARAERLLVRHYPGLRKLFCSFLREATKERSLVFQSLAVRLHHALLDSEYEDDNYWVNKGRTLFEECVPDLENYKKFREIASILANDLGQMRVRFNAQQYAVAPAYCDDNSYLWDYAAKETDPPPPEQEIQVQRARMELREARDDDGEDGVSAQAATEESFSYPEWDYRINVHRDAWCTVVERAHRLNVTARGFADEMTRTAEAIAIPKAMRKRQLNRRFRLRRQWEGDEIDLNAAIDLYVDRRRNVSAESRIFMQPGRNDRSLSVLVLMDLSESANDRIAGRFDSILDIEKKASLMLANAVSDTGNRLAIHGFSSNTRHEVHYYRLVEFGEKLDTRQARTLNSVAAAYSTRMGAALRHAAALISAEENEKKIVIMVTDGAPGDIDVFDDEYLIQDARVSVTEALQSGVDCFCLTLDANAERYVKRIFGSRNYRIVDDPLSLPAQLSSVFSHIAGDH